jgi:hypothetical protein
VEVTSDSYYLMHRLEEKQFFFHFAFAFTSVSEEIVKYHTV